MDALYEENGRVCGVICGDDILRARYVVLAEGANSVLAERHGLVTRPAGEAMALGIKEVLSLETSATPPARQSAPYPCRARKFRY